MPRKELCMNRCPWCLGDEKMIRYHDTEWGVPVHDEKTHFEFLLLECFQAGLSWKTILHKREAFGDAFDQFDCRRVASYGEDKINELIQDSAIIRNRRKIEAAIHNARAFLQISEQFGSFDAYIWGFTDGRIIHTDARSQDEIPATSPLSDTVSRDLKARGFKFVGSVTIYAHLQAIGVIDDHILSCFRRQL